MRKQAINTAVGIAFISFGVGCLALMGPRDASKELKAAEESKDIAKLEVLCNDTSLGDPQDHSVPMNASPDVRDRIQAGRRTRTEACHEAEALKSDASGGGGCDGISERFTKARMSGSEDYEAHYGRWAMRFAKCNDYKDIFEKLTHVGDFGPGSAGEKVLKGLDKDGSLEAEFVKYAEANQGRAFLATDHDDYVANHIANWLVKRKAFKNCAVIANAAKDSSENVRANMLFYFSDAGCNKETNEIGVGLLTSDKANHRRLACANLGKTGDHHAAEKVKILAETDAFMQVVQDRASGALLKEYTVREACQQAYGKMRLRGN